MSTVPARRRSTITTAALVGLGLTAATLAVGTGLLTIGSSLNATVASAELAAGAALMSRTTWMLPALFTVMVFAGMVVAVHLIGGRRRPQTTEARVRTRDNEPHPPSRSNSVLRTGRSLRPPADCSATSTPEPVSGAG